MLWKTAFVCVHITSIASMARSETLLLTPRVGEWGRCSPSEVKAVAQPCRRSASLRGPTLLGAAEHDADGVPQNALSPRRSWYKRCAQSTTSDRAPVENQTRPVSPRS